MRVALVHDWLTGMRGGEKVLAALCRMYPDAHLFTLLRDRHACESIVRGRKLATSLLNRFPGVTRYYRTLLPVMPLAARTLDCRDFDLVISSSHCVAKGIRISPQACHVCYCHTPMRYIWHQAEQYEQRMSLHARAVLRLAKPYLQAWDCKTARSVDAFVANSNFVAERIRQVYQRDAEVVYPPVDVQFYTPAKVQREDYYLVVSSLVPYKCVDHAVEAFGRLPHRLLVIGSGPMLQGLRQTAPPNVQFLGWQSDEVVREHYRRCRALLFPGEEDFGMVPVEAMACGAPVIACRAGGALETVHDVAGFGVTQATGVLYGPQSPIGLAQAIGAFEKVRDAIHPEACRARAECFDETAFAGGMAAVCERALQVHAVNHD